MAQERGNPALVHSAPPYKYTGQEAPATGLQQDGAVTPPTAPDLAPKPVLTEAPTYFPAHYPPTTPAPASKGIPNCS